jgi:hypothetical protein
MEGEKKVWKKTRKKEDGSSETAGAGFQLTPR